MARALWNPAIALKAAGLPESLVPVATASKITGYSVITIRTWIKNGWIKAWGVPWASRYLVDLRDIIQQIEPIGKPVKHYQHSPVTRAKMHASQKARQERERAQRALAAQQSASQPQAEPAADPSIESPVSPVPPTSVQPG